MSTSSPSTEAFSALRLAALLAGGVLTVWTTNAIIRKRRRNPKGLPYVPGPKGQLFVGNLAQIPRDQAWVGYHEVCKEYGDMTRLQVLGTEILVIDSLKHATALLEKRAANYSDRPDIPVAYLIDTYWSFAIMPYGNRWRQHRRVFHQYLNQNAISKYHPIIHFERDAFLRKLKEDPNNFFEHIQLLFGSTIMRTTYGFDDIGKNAELIHSAETLVREFGLATAPGAYLVSTFPALRHVPDWFPGTGWKQYMKGLADLSKEVLETPFKDAKDNLANGHKEIYPSIAGILLDRLPEMQDAERAQAETMARNVCALTYIAGAETSIASSMVLVLALANHPEVQRKAQAELDAAVGSDRLPTINDRPSLPYVHAIVKELGRWYNAAPLGVVHCSTEDDEYEGYFIPKGTMIIPNVWSMMHDPETFERPDDFLPERYLKDGRIDPSVPDGELATFGFGRRICPGRHFSNDVIFLYAASLLAMFDIAPPKDESGRSVELKLQLGNGPVAVPKPFESAFTLRPGREGLLGRE